MKACPIALAVAACLALTLQAQEPSPATVPILKDIPVLGSLFRGQEEVLWFRLDDEPLDATLADGDKGPRALTSTQSWLLETVRSRFPGLSSVEWVERSVWRSDGERAGLQRESGVELRGPSQVLNAGPVRAFLEKFREQRRRVLKITFWIAVTNGNEAPVPTRAAAADRRTLERRVAELRKHGMMLANPTLTVFNGQRAVLSQVNAVSYVKDFEVEIVQGATIADPVIDVVNEGIIAGIHPLIDPESGQIIVSAEVVLKTLKRPMGHFRTKIGGLSSEAVTFDVPEVATSRWSTEDLRLAPGEDGFMVAGLAWKNPAKDWDEPHENVEVWCLVEVADFPPGGESAAGTVIAVDATYHNLFVNWPAAVVPDDPWDKAPKRVGVFREGTKVGEASSNGGWVLPDEADPKRRVVAVYHVTEGEGREGDEVRPLR